MQSLIDQLHAARAVSTPLLALTTPDQPAMVEEIAEKLNGTTPVIGWDRARGMRALTDAGQEAMEALCDAEEDLTAQNISIATSGPA